MFWALDMHYFHSREESAEILRRALHLMAPHKAAFHPLSYALWYEHAADLNPSLSRDLEKYAIPGAPLSERDVARLYALHIAARDIEAFEQAQSQLRTLLEGAEGGTSSTQTAAVQFAHMLESIARRLTEPVDSSALKSMVSELLSQTQMMQQLTTEFADKLSASRLQVKAVVERLERAQTDPLRDPLTGLNSRHGFKRAADAVIASASDLDSVALLAADVDRFKKITDTYGHVIADKVLLRIAEILRTHIKPTDVASRLGGDEFVVLCPRTSSAEAAALAESIRESVSQTLISGSGGSEHAGLVSLSIGLAIGDKNETLESLRYRADAALYKAKNAGRNRVSISPQCVPQLKTAAAGKHAL
jgi:diguanylate cyclase